MREALYDPRKGYYRRIRHPSSEGGDYTTAATLGPALACAVAARATRDTAGIEAPTFIDVGCGSGALVRDLEPLLPGWDMVGVDPHEPEDLPPRAVWRESIADVEPVEGVIFSSELFDALPCGIARFRDGAWRELGVEENAEGNRWVETGPVGPETADWIQSRSIPGEEGRIIEIAREDEKLYGRMASLLTAGMIITIDYGRTADILYRPGLFPGGTLIAYRRHSAHRDILRDKGEQDITRSIDFSALRRAGERAGLRTVTWSTLASFVAGEMGAMPPGDSAALLLGDIGQDQRVLIQTPGR